MSSNASSAYDQWRAKARAVRIEDEIERRGIHSSASVLSGSGHVQNAEAMIGSASTLANRSLTAADAARAVTLSTSSCFWTASASVAGAG